VPLPHFLELEHPTLFASCLFFSAACLLFSLVFFSFFPGCGSVCPGGYTDLSQGCLWEYCMLSSSPGGLLLPSRLGAGVWWHKIPAVSPFNMEWGCYVWAGGVELSEFCLFLVIFPARCISSVSPRFYFRKHTFCFLLLVAILESSPEQYSWLLQN
jgi:hypothetical protein